MCIRDRIKAEVVSKIKKVNAPFADDNWRLILQLEKPCRNTAWLVRDAVKEAIDKDGGFKIRGRDTYCMVEIDPHTKAKNSEMRRCSEIVRGSILKAPGDDVVADTRKGVMQYKKDDQTTITIGRMSFFTYKWTWFDEQLKKVTDLTAKNLDDLLQGN